MSLFVLDTDHVSLLQRAHPAVAARPVFLSGSRPARRRRLESEMSDFEVRPGTVSTSLSLVRRAKAGDREAWQRLARIYSPLVYRWARQSHLQDSDAADVLQNVFLAVLKGIERFRYERPEDSFRGWLRTITCNEVRRFCDRRLVRPRATGGSDAQRQLQQVPADQPELSGSEQSVEESGVLHRALECVRVEFEQRTWQAFCKATFTDQSASEIAHELGMSDGAVRQAKYRVLGRLRELLDDQ